MNNFPKWCAVLLFQTAVLFGQDTYVSHEVSFPKDDASWSVTFEETKFSKNNLKEADSTESGQDEEFIQPGKFKKIEMVRMGKLRRDSVTWQDGSNAEFWWPLTADLVLWKKVGEPVRAMRSGYFDFQRFDRSSFGWVNESTFTGMKPLNGKPCQHYRREVKTAEGDTIVYQAWLDPETRKPVALLVGEGTPGIFTFDRTLPDQPLTLPDDFSEMLKRCEKAMTPRKSFGR